MLLLLLVVAFACVVFYLIYYYRLYQYIGKDNRDKIFADECSAFTKSKVYNKKTRAEKEELFGHLKGFRSSVAPKEEGLRILEIGIGSGSNFDFYPSKCRLIAEEPNLNFLPHLKENLKEYAGIKLENTVSSGAENMPEIADNSVDVVVSCIVLCSVQDVQAIYKEIRRILVPGGKFLYLEHVLDRPTSWLSFRQQVLSVIGFWQFRWDGCRLDWNFDDEIQKSNCFSSVIQRRFYLPLQPLDYWALHYVKPTLFGHATK